MIPSLNEIESTVWKASRGAGLAWGLAEELGQAARWLADHGLGWSEPVVACLDAVEQAGGRAPAPLLIDRIWRPAPGQALLSPALCGPLLSDLAPQLARDRARMDFGPMAQPILLLPFAARAAREIGGAFTLSWPGARFSCRRSGATGESAQWPAVATASVAFAAADMESGAGHELTGHELTGGAERGPVEPEALRRLEGWVRRTYVPASLESRLLGAGAGIADND